MQKPGRSKETSKETKHRKPRGQESRDTQFASAPRSLKPRGPSVRVTHPSAAPRALNGRGHRETDTHSIGASPESNGGQKKHDTLASAAATQNGRGQGHSDTQIAPAAPATENGRGHPSSAAQAHLASPVPAIQEIASRRNHCVRQMVRNSNACLSPIRRAIGFKLGMEEEERRELSKRAMEIVKAVRQENHDTLRTDADRQIAESLSPLILAHMEAEKPMAGMRAQYESELKHLVKTLPVWPHVRDEMFGLGDLGLSLIIGAAGDLSNYANPAKLWKRLGLAVIDGVAQGKRTNVDEALKHGFKPMNRALMWNIGEAIVKVGGPYRKLYDDRKVYELTKEVKQKDDSMKPISKGHAHKRAKRYVEKRILRDLWNAWRGLPHGDTHRAGAILHAEK